MSAIVEGLAVLDGVTSKGHDPLEFLQFLESFPRSPVQLRVRRPKSSNRVTLALRLLVMISV
jgi:hypothetical protein